MLQDVLSLWRKMINIKSEIFNLTKDTLTVKEVANICKKHNPKIHLKRDKR